MLLAVAVAIVFAATGPVAFYRNGSTGLWAAALAALFCLTGALMALIASHALRGPQFALLAMFVGMAARMGVPLFLGVALHLRGGPLAEAGLLYYLLVFYPVTLAVETALSLPTRQMIAKEPSPTSNTAY